MVGSDGPFLIRGNLGHGVYAGSLPSHRQALVGLCVYGYILMAMFDGGGTLQKVIRRDQPSYLLHPTDFLRCYRVDEDSLFEYLKREFGFQLANIQVREFRVPDEDFAVYRLPESYQDFLKDPRNPLFDNEDRQVLPDRIKHWTEEGSFVLVWGNDYWVSGEGEIIAS
jgi:hypothetical protein